MAHYRENQAISIKDGDIRNIVTETDFIINDFLTKEIKSNYPEYAIYSEEANSSFASSGLLWVIDPIDGSANFARQVPHFAISLGLMVNQEPAVGAIFNPITNDLFSFKKGEGAFLNEKIIKVSDTADLSLAYVLMLTGKKKELRDWGAALYRKLLERANKTRNFASSSLDICFLATGRVDGVFYGQVTTLDIVPAIGLLLEAGGKITDEAGRPIRFLNEPSKIVASNGKLHNQLLELV